MAEFFFSFWFFLSGAINLYNRDAVHASTTFLTYAGMGVVTGGVGVVL